MNTFKIAFSVVGVIALSLGGLAQAQELEVVTVTAQKREQSLQEVPISISVVDNTLVKNNIVRDVFDLQVLVPALQVQAVDPPGQGTAFALRGLGNSVFNMGFDPAVATFVDGVYRSRSGLAAASDMVDVARVEVLKGPQGTLFGKNTTAGLVHFINNRPDMESVYGEVEFDYEEYDRKRVKGFVNIPVSEKAAMRFSGSFGKGDGFLKLAGSGDKIHDLDRYSVRGQLLLQPSEDLNILFSVDLAELDEKCCTPLRNVNDPLTSLVNVPAATAAGSGIVDPANIDKLRAESNIGPFFKAKDRGALAQIDWDLGGVTLTSLTASRKYDDSNEKDNDFTGVDVLRSNQDIPKITLFSQELRLAGAGDNYDWILGAYYSKENIVVTNEFIWGSQVTLFPIFAPGLFGNQPGRAFFHKFDQDVKSTALFAHGNYHLTDQLTLTAGVRWSEDKKDGTMVSDQPGGNIFGLPNALPLPVVYDYDASTKDSEPTYTGSLQYAFNDNVQGFATYSRGYKSGGISMTRDAGGSFLLFGNPDGSCPSGTIPVGGPLCAGAPQDPTFDKETSDHFEVGVKSEMMDKRLRINVSAWHTSFSDLQVQTLRQDGSFAVSNIKGASSEGVELDSTLAVTENLTATFSVQYLDAKYDNGLPPLTNAPGYLPLGGHRLPYASDWTGSVGLNYVKPISSNGWNLLASGNLYARTDYDTFTEPVVGRVQPGYGLLNLRLGIANDRWEFAVWCKNCGDKRFRWSDFQIPFDGLLPGASTRFTHIGDPRFYGISAIMKF